MANVTSPSLVRQLGSLFEGGSVAGLSDRQLSSGSSRAATRPARPPSPPWWPGTGRWCWASAASSWATTTHAEDAFQAVFLVLARKARSIRDPDLLGNWLYGVALRTARKARGRLARQRKNEEDGVREVSGRARRAAPADQAVLDREQAEALHGEIDRLPGPSACRSCSATSRASRSTRRRDGSAGRPARSAADWPGARQAPPRADPPRRGALARGASAAMLAPRSASASVSSPPVRFHDPGRDPVRGRTGRRRRGALRPAAALAQEVLRSMLIHKLKLTVLTLLLLAAVATGAGIWLTLAGDAGGAREPPGEPLAKIAPGRSLDLPTARSRRRRPDVRGRPRARPRRQAGARARSWTSSAASPRAWIGATRSIRASVLLGRGGTDADGRFRLDAPARRRPASSRSTPWPPPPGTASAGPSSTPTPSSPRPRSGSGPSSPSAAGWST